MPKGDPWFGPNQLPDPRVEYVAWLDLMGTGKIMQWSPKTATTNVGKLIVATIEADSYEDMNFYPVMDGIYFTHDSANKLIAVFWDIFLRFADILIERHEKPDTPNVHLTPLLRAGIAHGEVYHGVDFKTSLISGHAFSELLLSGKPVADAHFAESEAPPFGINLAPSVSDGDGRSRLEWWQIESYGNRMKDALHAYFDFFEGRSEPDYPDHTIEKHRKQVDMYFP